MKAKGVRLHAANNLRLEEFELPEITDDEILVKVVSDSICMSTYNVRSSELCYAPVSAVVTQSSAILGRDGCLNFFAGPTDKKFSAEMNFYDVHYNSTHVMGTTGGNTADMIESLELTAAKRINPAVMVTHIGGLDAAAETTLNLPKIPGGKKLIYTHLIANFITEK